MIHYPHGSPCFHRHGGACRLEVYSGVHSPAKCKGCAKFQAGKADWPAEPVMRSTMPVPAGFDADAEQRRMQQGGCCSAGQT